VAPRFRAPPYVKWSLVGKGGGEGNGNGTVSGLLESMGFERYGLSESRLYRWQIGVSQQFFRNRLISPPNVIPKLLVLLPQTPSTTSHFTTSTCSRQTPAPLPCSSHHATGVDSRVGMSQCDPVYTSVGRLAALADTWQNPGLSQYQHPTALRG